MNLCSLNLSTILLCLALVWAVLFSFNWEEYPCESDMHWRHAAVFRAPLLKFLHPSPPLPPPLHRIMLDYFFSKTLRGQTRLPGNTTCSSPYQCKYTCTDSFDQEHTYTFSFIPGFQGQIVLQATWRALSILFRQVCFDMFIGIGAYVAALLFFLHMENVFLGPRGLRDTNEQIPVLPPEEELVLMIARPLEYFGLVDPIERGRAVELRSKKPVDLPASWAPPRPLEAGDRCPICFDTLEGPQVGKGELDMWESNGKIGQIHSTEHCRWTCGKVVHRHCMCRWGETCRKIKPWTTCPCCNSPWVSREDLGALGEVEFPSRPGGRGRMTHPRAI